MDVNKRIEELRIQKGLSIYELTVKSDLSENTIYHWYKQKSKPSLNGIISVCRALEISIEEFFNPKTKDALSMREMELVELFSSCPVEEQDAILTLLKTRKT